LRTQGKRTVALISVLVSAALLPGCGKKDEGAAQQPQAAKPADPAKPATGAPPAAASAAPAPAKPSGMPVKAQPVKLDLVLNEVTAVGSLIADEAVIIRPEIAGRVIELPFREGQAVQRGAKLVVIDGSEYDAVLAQAKADAKTETQRYERTIDLFKNKFVSQDAVDVAKGNMDRAVARVQENEARLAKTKIYAPFSGILGLRMISPGAYVKAGDDIVRLENTSRLKLDFRVPELYVSKLKTNQVVSVRTDAYPNEAFEGRIYALEPSVDEKTRTVVARAEIPNKQGKLRPGMFGRVNVLLESRPNAVIVPEQAIWPQGRDSFVYKVVDGKAVLTKIDIGNRRPGEVEVAKGLVAGDVVVTDGQMKIKDGAPVMVLPSAPPPPPAVAGPTPAPKAGG
jgi:membrane fusion protein (multidrug efflux system)